MHVTVGLLLSNSCNEFLTLDQVNLEISRSKFSIENKDIPHIAHNTYYSTCSRNVAYIDKSVIQKKINHWPV